jgi:hypothetical protein
LGNYSGIYTDSGIRKFLIVIIQKYLFSFLVLISVVYGLLLFAQDITVELVQTDGSIQKQIVPVDTKPFVFFDGDHSTIKEVQNLQKLTDLESLAVYNVSNISDWTFFDSLPKLKTLHMASVDVPNLQFVTGLKQMEVLELDVYLSGKEQLKPIDFSALTKLKRLEFYTIPKLTAVPRLLNIRNRPEFDISNSMITSISKSDAEILKQFGSINVDFSPVTADYVARTPCLKDLPFTTIQQK